MTKPKIILIPGNGGGTTNDHWFPYVRDELEYRGYRVVSKNFPDSMFSRSEYWLPFLKNELKASDNSILIGHSSGAVAAMRYAEENKVLGSILVAANHTHLNDPHEKLSGYFDQPWNWEKIRNNQEWIIQFASLDDPYIPIDEARHINRMLESEYYEYDNHGHFGDDILKEDFPEIITILREKLSK